MAKFLDTETIYSYLMGDEEQETLIMCRPEDLFTQDQNLYMALAAVVDRDERTMSRLVKFLEKVNIVSFSYHEKKQRPVLTHEMAEEIRRRTNKRGFGWNKGNSISA
jgi:hypothetical protein